MAVDAEDKTKSAGGVNDTTTLEMKGGSQVANDAIEAYAGWWHNRLSLSLSLSLSKAMDVDAVAADAKTAKSTKSAGTTTTADDDNESGKASKDAMAVDEKAKKVDEPTFEVLANPSRVTLQQLSHVTFDVDERCVLCCLFRRIFLLAFLRRYSMHVRA